MSRAYFSGGMQWLPPRRYLLLLASLAAFPNLAISQAVAAECSAPRDSCAIKLGVKDAPAEVRLTGWNCTLLDDDEDRLDPAKKAAQLKQAALDRADPGTKIDPVLKMQLIGRYYENWTAEADLQIQGILARSLKAGPVMKPLDAPPGGSNTYLKKFCYTTEEVGSYVRETSNYLADELNKAINEYDAFEKQTGSWSADELERGLKHFGVKRPGAKFPVADSLKPHTISIAVSRDKDGQQPDSAVPPPPPAPPGDDAHGDDARGDGGGSCLNRSMNCKQELAGLRESLKEVQGDLADGKKRLQKMQKEAKIDQGERASEQKVLDQLRSQLDSCIADLRHDAKRVGAKVIVADRRVVGIGPAKSGDELTEARVKTLSNTMTLCNKLSDRWQEAGRNKGPRLDYVGTIQDIKREMLEYQDEEKRLVREIKAREKECAALEKQCRKATQEADRTPPADKPASVEYETNWGRMTLSGPYSYTYSGYYATDNGSIHLDADMSAGKDWLVTYKGYWIEDDSDVKCASPSPDDMDKRLHWGWVKLRFSIDEAGDDVFLGTWGYCSNKAVAGEWRGKRIGQPKHEEQ